MKLSSIIQLRIKPYGYTKAIITYTFRPNSKDRIGSVHFVGIIGFIV